MLREASLDETTLLSELGTSPQGLTDEGAKERLREHGPNTYPERKKNPLAVISAQLRNLFNILLIVAALLSFTSGILSSDASSINMGLVILIIVLISIIFNLVQERQAEQAVRSIRQLVPMNAKVSRNGQVRLLPIEEIVPGDILTLEEGDRVPADARMLTCFNVAVDNSALTGESEPQRRETGAQKEPSDATQCPNLVFAGTTVVSGTGTAVVLSTGERTQFGTIINLARSIKEPPSPLQKEIDRTARLDFMAAVMVGIVFLLIAYLVLHLEFAASLLFMIGVMVCLVPEGFQITMTLSLALSSVAMARRNVVVKRLSSVETLGSVTVICTDKTGTITEGQMTARWIWAGGDLMRVIGEGYEPDGAVFLGERKVAARDRPDLRRLAEVAALANTATLIPPLDRMKTRWTAVGDPTEAALLVMSTKCGIDYKHEQASQKRVGMIPFESARKMMTSVHEDGKGGFTAYVKGATSEILSRSVEMHWGGQVVPLTKELSAQVAAQADSFAREAFRVLAIATRSLSAEPSTYESSSLEDKLTFVGLVALYDPPRAETPNAVERARQAGIRIVMMTGDHELTAESIARKVGIISTDDSAVRTGRELEASSDEEVSKLLDIKELVFARVTPAQKLRIVRLLKAKGETVAVTGDGVNDSPALLEADIGIAMGITGTDVAKESSDMVLMDDNFASIVNGVEEGRGVFDNLQKFVVYVFTHNWGELVAFIAFVLLGTPLPLAVIQVLAIDLLMEIPPSLSLTLEPPEQGIMLRRPRPRTARLFSVNALARSMYIGAIVGVFTLFWCFSVWSTAGWTLGSSVVPDHTVYLQGTTVVLVGIMAGQLGMLFATRTNVRSTFSVSLSRNRWILRALAIEVLILFSIVYIPFLQDAFLTSGIPLVFWPIIFTIAPVVILLEEARKLVLRRVLKPEKLPAPLPATVPRPASLVERPYSPTFEELAPPVMVPLTGVPGEGNAVLISAALCKQTGSKLIIAYSLPKPVEYVRQIEIIAEGVRAEQGVPIEYLEITPGTGDSDQGMVDALNAVETKEGIAAIVVPIDKGALLGKRRAVRRLKWIPSMAGRKIILVDSTGRPNSPLLTGSPRILIPILQRFHREPFKIAQALSAHTVFPDVDVVAAKVVQIPRTVPLYSIYRPESLVDTEAEYSIIRFLAGDLLYKRIRPLVLLVRRSDRDLLHFIKERKVDVIILGGEWHRQLWRLDGSQRRIAKKAPSVIVMAMQNKRDPEGTER